MAVSVFATRAERAVAKLACDGFADVRFESSAGDFDAFPSRVVLVASTQSQQIWFQGHFPAFAVLPGVVLLQRLVVGSARILWPELGALRELRGVKFLRPVLPGDALVVELSRESLTEAHFRVANHGSELRAVARGALEFLTLAS